MNRAEISSDVIFFLVIYVVFHFFFLHIQHLGNFFNFLALFTIYFYRKCQLLYIFYSFSHNEHDNLKYLVIV